MMGSLLTEILLGSGKVPQEADNRLCENLKVCYFSSKYTSMNSSMSLDMKILIKYNHSHVPTQVQRGLKQDTLWKFL